MPGFTETQRLLRGPGQVELQFLAPLKNEPNIWMRKDANMKCLGMLSCFADDLAFVMKDPHSLVHMLKAKCKHKLNGTGEIAFHFGCNFLC